MKALVFVSSVIEEFREERTRAKSLIDGYGFLQAWVFEHEPAAATALEESYVQFVRDCSIFVLIVGETITEPVRAEYLEAKAAGKRILILTKVAQTRSAAAIQLLAEADAKYASFGGATDFEQVLQHAINSEVARTLNEPFEKRAARKKETVLREALASGRALRITPIAPQHHSQADFQLRALTQEELVVQKLGAGFQVSLPFNRADIIPGGFSEPLTLQLQGRLQWLTVRQLWQFFPETPADTFGVAKAGSPFGQDVALLKQRLERLGFKPQWNREDEATYGTWEVVYDDDGRYFQCVGRVRTDWVEILVAKKG